jgi:hypothetical protein
MSEATIEKKARNKPERERRDVHVHVVHPNAVYGLAQARFALGLTKSALPREIRSKRLRVAKRGGTYFILGQWLLDWIVAGEISRGGDARKP